MTIFVLSPLYLYAQNLVNNPSFENYKSCPRRISPSNKYFNNHLVYWYSPSGATPDYYNKCSRGDTDIPKNFTGYAQALNGDAYIGLIMASGDGIPSNGLWTSKCYREYIACRLKTKLVKDKKYIITLHIRLSSNSSHGLHKLGIYFSNKRIKKTGNGLLKVAPQVNFNSDKINSKSNWVKLSGIYKAKGGEEYICIGNFNKNEYIFSSDKTGDQNIKDFVYKRSFYYLIDMVTLFEYNDHSENDSDVIGDGYFWDRDNPLPLSRPMDSDSKDHHIEEDESTIDIKEEILQNRKVDFINK